MDPKDLDAILKDPSFRALPVEDQKAIVASMQGQPEQPVGTNDQEKEKRTALQMVMQGDGMELLRRAGQSVKEVGKGIAETALDIVPGTAERSVSLVEKGARAILPESVSQSISEAAAPFHVKMARARHELAPPPGDESMAQAHTVGRVAPLAVPAIVDPLGTAGAVTGGVVGSTVAGEVLGGVGSQITPEMGYFMRALGQEAGGLYGGIKGPKVAQSTARYVTDRMRTGAADTMAKLLRIDPGQAQKLITFTDDPQTIAQRDAMVERMSEKMGVGNGLTLAKRATAESNAAADRLGGVKSSISQEPVPIDVLAEAEARAGNIPELNYPPRQVPPPGGLVLNPQGQPAQPAPPPQPPPPPRSHNVAQVRAADEVGGRLGRQAEEWQQHGDTLPAGEVLKTREQLGSTASPAFSLAPTAEASELAGAAKRAYIPITQELHRQFPQLAKADLDYSESRLLADQLRQSVLQNVVNPAADPATAVMLKAGAGAPWLAAADTGVGNALADIPRSYGMLALAMQIVKSPLWRSAGIAGRVAIAKAIEQGALSPTMNFANQRVIPGVIGSATANRDSMSQNEEPQP